MKKLMKITCLIFDVDGTIIDNSMEIVRLFQDIVKEYTGRDMSDQEVLSLWGPPGDEIFRNTFPPEIRDEAWKKFIQKYREALPSQGYFTKAQFTEMKNHIHFITIFTGKSRQTMTITMKKLGLNNIFDLIFTGNDVTRSKPFPDALFQIIGILQLKKEETLFLGDSHLDIQAGKAAGIKTAGALWGSVEPEKLISSQPDFVFKTPNDFRAFVLSKERSN
ncbi:MAG: HAD family hydrolase [Candidatus Hodarchaeales archaeon]|jgi:phosphoglycolate phosphatase/pyrophosphatase PpaX